MPKLRLFKIDVGGDPIYFDNRRVAKHKRDQMLDEGGTNISVMRGPDHRRGESFNKSEQMEPSHGKKHKRPVGAL